jgi:hypothetical protein
VSFVSIDHPAPDKSPLARNFKKVNLSVIAIKAVDNLDKKRSGCLVCLNTSDGTGKKLKSVPKSQYHRHPFCELSVLTHARTVNYVCGSLLKKCFALCGLSP